MAAGGGVHLEPLGRFPGLRVVAWHESELYAGCGYRLLRWSALRKEWHPVASFETSVFRRASSKWRLGARLLRDGYHTLTMLRDHTLIVVLPGVIGRVEPGGVQVEVAFRVPRGTRPLALARTPEGAVFWGEYFDNPRRDAVHVYGSTDGGRSWTVVYTFAPGEIRHVHSVSYDPYGACLWVLTGDEETECRVLRASVDWRTVDVVLAGNQQARAVSVVARPDALYFATDTPDEQNFIYRLERTGRLDRLVPIASSSFWSCAVGSALFFSTAVEPSEVNRGVHAMLYGSVGGEAWTPCARWKRDRWPPKFFQYPNIVLPAGENGGSVLAATGVAVLGEDGVTHLWKVRSE